MRRAVITIRWEGPDKLVREMIDDALDKLFFDLTMTGKVQSTLTDADRRFVLDILHRVVSRANPLPAGGYDPECGDGASLVSALAALEAHEHG